MAFKDLAEAIDSDKTGRDRLIAVYIGVLAVLLAICGVGGGNAIKDATARNIEASNTWAFFQAKNIRRHELRLQIAELEVLLASQPELVGRGAHADRRQDRRNTAPTKSRYTSEPETGEGVEELRSGRARSRCSATSPCARTPISTTARRCCRSPSCWHRWPSSPAARSFWC